MAHQLDFETQSEFLLNLVAVDNPADEALQRTASAVVRVHLLDVNDNDPVFSETVFEMSVEENAAPHSLVGRLTAADADSGNNAHLHFRVLDADRQKDIVVHPQTGEVRTLRTFDREALVESIGTDSLTFKVVVEDDGKFGICFLFYFVFFFMIECQA